MKMKKTLIDLLMFGTWVLVAVGEPHSFADSEEPSAAAWLEGRWSYGADATEEITQDSSAGCLCRIRSGAFAVCYGGGKCTSFPRNITLPDDILDLRLKTTKIQKITQDDFKNFQQLHALWIDANNNLKNISASTFADMANLKNLSISYNIELKFLHPDVFDGLIRLEWLKLVKNGFTQISDAAQALQTRYLPRLRFLSLCENSFPTIKDNSFAALQATNLQELELVLCQITKIHPKAFANFRNLKKLRLGDNLLREDELTDLFGQLVKRNISVKLLNLYNSGFRRDGMLTDLLQMISKLKVSHLVLARNHIENISNELFPYMPDLEILDLREVSAVTVEPNALLPSVLPNLKVLLLAGNKLPGIIPGVKLTQISFLDLSENSYSPSSFFDASTEISNSSLKLNSLDLSFNKVSTIRRNTFSNFPNLQVLGLKNITLFYISRRAFNNLTQLKVLNLENNPVAPFNRLESPIFDSLVNLESLYLGNCKIHWINNSLIFANLKKLRYLNLKDNDLITISVDLFAPLVSLVGIDLSENRLQSWMTRRFENNTELTTALLFGNRFHTITVAMIQDLEDATYVDLSNNPFTCDCWSFNQTILWIRTDEFNASNSSVITNSNHLCSAPESWKEQQVGRFLESEHLCAPAVLKSNFTTSVYIFMAVVVSISVILGVLVYVYRWYIRYWVFLARMAFLRRHSWLLKKNKVFPGDYKYDVFVSYSHEDRNFIVRLVAMLENQHPFLKLCVYERDFEIGTVISTTVMDKVSTSRRTLLVVSNSFAKSQWCMWELQLAESHRMFFRNTAKDGVRNDPLVMIKLGPIADSNMTPTLKFLLKSRIYLEWNHEPKKQVEFWRKLRATLSTQEKNKVPDVDSSILAT